jgi:D-alanyl-D-alanine carboxypeptidase
VGLADQALRGGSPGVALAVREAGAVSIHVAGVADVDTAQTIEPATTFAVGSVDKTFLAALVLQLVDEGALELDAAAPLPDVPFETGPITVRQLLQHTSGLPDYLQEPMRERLLEDPTRRWSADEVLGMLPAPDAAPGERWAYSNTNYLLLARIVETTGRKPLADQVHDRVLAPLGLAGTGFGTPSARGYAPGDNWLAPDPADLVDMTQLSASLGYLARPLCSTAVDVCRFLGALLGGELLPMPLVCELLSTVPADGIEFDGYGLGIGSMSSVLGLAPSPCGPVWGHLGLAPGYTTIAFSRRDGSRQAVVMANIGLAPDAWRALGEVAWQAFCD